MILQGKCSPKVEQLESIVNDGLKSIELQLLSDTVYEDVISTMSRYPDLDVTAVHTPFGDNDWDKELNLEYITKPELYDKLYTTCKIANTLCKDSTKGVGVVIHNTLSLNQWVCMPLLFDAVSSILKSLVRTFPNIYFLIENVSWAGIDYRLTNGFLLTDTFDIVCIFRDRIGNCVYGLLDTCHWLASNKFISMLDTCTCCKSIWNKPTMWLKDILCGYNDVIKHIHLAGMKDWGITSETHGQPINTPQYNSLLYDIFSYANKDTIITVEVKETDYTDRINQRSTIDYVTKYCEKYSFTI